MIPKPSHEITWADLEALQASGREEDDTIEFKASFSGGADFLAFNEKQQANAVDAITKEVIAFLNARGGDVLIGATEYKNDHPRIERLSPLTNVVATADRLAQALAAMIEPAQSILTVRAIPLPADANNGALLIRSPASVRAPHRSRRTRECYVRRGRESVPMAMDEIQDLTVRRVDLLNDRLGLLDERFSDIGAETLNHIKLSPHRFHIRAVFIPIQAQQIDVDQEICSALWGYNPTITKTGKEEQIDVPFRFLPPTWKPVLRGRRADNLTENAWGKSDIFCLAKEVRSSGLMVAEFGCRISLETAAGTVPGFYHDWLPGFLANVLSSFERVWFLRPQMGEGILRIGTYSAGKIVSCWDVDSYRSSHHNWPDGISILPDFGINDGFSFRTHFVQAQEDLAALIGQELKAPFKFV